MQIIYLIGLTLSLLSPHTTVAASPIIGLQGPKLPAIEIVAPLTVSSSSPVTNAAYIAAQAKAAGLDVGMVLTIAAKESDFNTQAIGDNGTSYGIWQIHNPAEKGMTIQQAQDLEYSTAWSLEQLKEGHCKIWSTCPTNR